ncbi:ketopantoate reductase [Arthrobacter gandavensis]|uniref:ketopantoate reductase family protein n=1 Tax=Arthrobacter gandavensis TaxID=169960 RepID=UPI0018907EFB|nr:2-dehydropantoate 2-reductase N-terminal domain-containing protein [Arthrobacter gandavensis]MBF4994722.1 ketopantoate reductase [Arthrobacter gandavensis]
MRILMFGRGVISTIYGKAFIAAGHEVAFAVRSTRIPQYGSSLTIDLLDGRGSVYGKRTRTAFTPALRDSSDPGGQFDVIVLSVGHHRLREAAATVAAYAGEATVLIFGNIWEDPPTAVLPLPADQVVFGFPGAGGGFHSEGALHGALFRSVTIGTAGDASDWRKGLVHGMFKQAGFAVKEEGDIRGWLWLHFAMDVGMFSQALKAGGLAKMIGDGRGLREAFRTSREMLPVLEARGIDLSRHRTASMPARLPRSAGTLSGWATRLFPIAQASLAAHANPNGAEPRAVMSDALASARLLGIPTPRLEQAWRYWQETESA